MYATVGRDGVRKESVASTDTSEASGWSQDQGQGTLSLHEETDTAISSAHRAETEDPESTGQPRHRRHSFDSEMLARGEELATQKTEARRYADCTDFRVSGEQRTLTEGERAFQEGLRAREEERRQQNTHEGYDHFAAGRCHTAHRTDPAMLYIPRTGDNDTHTFAHYASLHGIAPLCNTTLTQNQLMARQGVPRDLPRFWGSIEEWPLFFATYRRTTNRAGILRKKT
uniref:Uncharacterized protein n=1 Tax=Anopheles atroparvus TaxID=41427 RepID=A0A182JBV1_ANOAO